MSPVATQQIFIAVIIAAILTALVIVWPYPDAVASALGLFAGLIVGFATGGRSA